MKSKWIIPMMLVALLAGSAVAFGQNKNEKKINRIMRKIEKQNKKLQKLNGSEYDMSKHTGSVVENNDWQDMRQEEMVQQKQAIKRHQEAMERYRDAMRKDREKMRRQTEDLRLQLKGLQDRELEVLKDMNGDQFLYYYRTPKLELNIPDTLGIHDEDFKIDFPKLKKDVLTLIGEPSILEIEKDLTGETISADFNFEIDSQKNAISLTVNGAIDNGKVTITIKKPDGTIFNENTLSPLANVNYNQKLNFEGEDESGYLGKWTVSIAAVEAKGKYHISIR